MVDLRVSKLKELCDPFEFHPWGVKVSKTHVREAIEHGDLLNSQIQDLRTPGVKDHAARIAYFIVNGFKDPISLDVGIPSIGYCPEWIVVDGNHRLASAIFLEQPFIPVQFSGSVDFFKELFDLTDADLSKYHLE